MTFTASCEDLQMTLTLLPVGDDWCCLLYGGERAHIGSVALAQPRPSLTGSGAVSSTSSVINLLGHKDEALCRRAAEYLTALTGANVVCTGGVHVDGISPEGIENAKRLLEELLERIGTARFADKSGL